MQVSRNIVTFMDNCLCKPLLSLRRHALTQTPKDAQLIYASDATCHAFKEGQFPLRNPDSMLAGVLIAGRTLLGTLLSPDESQWQSAIVKTPIARTCVTCNDPQPLYADVCAWIRYS